MLNSLSAPMDRVPNSRVSVVICCHNSETLLPTTITHLKNQHVDGDLKWEALVIDNASTDNTALVARHEVLVASSGKRKLRSSSIAIRAQSSWVARFGMWRETMT
jgi:hypothetical protein